MAVVYTHTRLDNNVVFYVGIGAADRPYHKRQRNRHWHNIVNKCGYRVDITHNDICIEEACSIERYLIAFYGRSDQNLGTLVNMTDGGEGTVNISEESKRLQIETAKRNGTYEAMCDRMRLYAKLIDKRGANSNVKRTVYLYDNDGKFAGKYVTIQEACERFGMSSGNVSARMDTGRSVKGYYPFSVYMGDVISEKNRIVSDKSKRGRNNVKKIQICLKEKTTGETLFFDTERDASLFLGKNKSYVSQRVRKGCVDVGRFKIVKH